jgi:hypothetical protein
MEDSNEDIHDILANFEANKKKAKKRLNSGDKGHRTESNLCKLLSARFNKPFERSVGSGNRWAQVDELTNSSKHVLVGDIVCPDHFRWVLECKGGYEDKVDFHSIFMNGNKTVDSFLDQVTLDAGRSNRDPMLLYKRNLKQWIAFIPTKMMPKIKIPYSLRYRDWTAVALELLLAAPDEFFFVGGA